jgi:hypothetical protein
LADRFRRAIRRIVHDDDFNFLSIALAFQFVQTFSNAHAGILRTDDDR